MDEKVEYLSFIQSIITRMSDRSFKLKELAISLTVAIFAIAKFKNKWVDSITYLAPIILFWFLDSYYLNIERKFRKKYDEAQKDSGCSFDLSLNGIGPCARVSKKCFDCELSDSDNKSLCFWICLGSKTELFYYCGLMIAILIRIIFY